MKFENLKKRLDKNRPMTTITMRMPEDVIEDLKRIAPLLGFSGYQPLMRTYIGQGLRTDLEKLENNSMNAYQTLQYWLDQRHLSNLRNHLVIIDYVV